MKTGVGTTLGHEGWCRISDGCGSPSSFDTSEPNSAGEGFVGYISWVDEPVATGWQDCTDDCFGSLGPASYFVECEPPPPACPETPGCYCAIRDEVRKVKCRTSAPWVDTSWQNQCWRGYDYREKPTILMEQPTDEECRPPEPKRKRKRRHDHDW